MIKQSKLILTIGIVLILLAVLGVLDIFVYSVFHIIEIIVIIIALLIGIGIVQVYLSSRKRKNRQEYYLSNDNTSVFISITSDTSNIPVINIDEKERL
jgi:hypothetical protein